VMRATLDPVIGQQRAVLDFDRLQLDWMAKRVELASMQGVLHQNESTLTRSTRLHEAKLITDDEYDLARNARDTLAAQIHAQQELITRLEPSINYFKSPGIPTTSDSALGMKAAIDHKHEELRLIEAQLGPIALVAPVDGVVTFIHRRSGETVGAAEAILQISSTRSERIIGFLRQPLTFEPKPGMNVEVRTRSLQRQIGTAQISQVGAQLEPISPTILAIMRLPISAVPTEYGVRVHVTSPLGLELRPGEHVDLILRD
jgi:multidrug resistance efflux pump